MRLDSSFISALVLTGILQTGALIFFAGVVSTTLREHSRRLDAIEDKPRHAR